MIGQSSDHSGSRSLFAGLPGLAIWLHAQKTAKHLVGFATERFIEYLGIEQFDKTLYCHICLVYLIFQQTNPKRFSSVYWNREAIWIGGVL